MDLHSLRNTPGARHRRKRVGCGESSGHGKTSGRGNKGQMARKGHKRKIGFEGGQMPLIRRLPKRGFTGSGAKFHLVNVGALAVFDAGCEVTPDVLRQSGLVKGRLVKVKVLGDGDLDRKLLVKAHAFSATARAKIEAAGGTCEVMAQ
jgi:large subunit ribosomal protein L15